MTACPELSSPALNMPVAGFSPLDLVTANEALTAWGHYLGPVNRPFGSQAWALDVRGELVVVAVSASAVSATVGGYGRGEVVELARLCSRPSDRWATRPMLRLWRQIGAPSWPYWPVHAAVAYSQNARHEGAVYRFDGWQRVSASCGSSGGGAWSRPRYATDAAHGRKSLWLFAYMPPVSGSDEEGSSDA